ncbi:MAG: RNA polymerase sigma factor [Candidatus Hydrogenedentes bacterium]|nr:RNA polymerase sigma factor [Candidatus Hydrogenedentota bacterium]
MDELSTYRAAGAADLSDEALMARVKMGDGDAFAVLVRRYEEPLFNYASKMLGDRAEAEDVFQETFLRVHLHGHRFWGHAPFRPWLYRIATNLCKDRLRYRKRRPEVPVTSLRHDEDWPDPVDQWAATSQRPDEAALARERSIIMERALADLSVKHRAVFLMAHQEGLSYAEIAKALWIPVGTVKSRMNKAVNRLMAAMEALD